MNRIVIGIGLALSIVMLFALLSEPEVDVNHDQGYPDAEKEAKHDESPSIQYAPETKKLPVNQVVSKPQDDKQNDQQQALEKDDNVLYKGSDVTHRFGLELIDSAVPPELSRKRVTIEGEIDGQRFILKVPENAMNDPLQLRIVDRSTETVKTVELGSGNDLKPDGGIATIKMAFSDPQAFSTEHNDVNNKVFP